MGVARLDASLSQPQNLSNLGQCQPTGFRFQDEAEPIPLPAP